LNVTAEVAVHLKNLRVLVDGGLLLGWRGIPTFMVHYNGSGRLFSIELLRRGGWDGWHGFGMMSIQLIEEGRSSVSA
jgi:hypothetical protein